MNIGSDLGLLRVGVIGAGLIGKQIAMSASSQTEVTVFSRFSSGIPRNTQGISNLRCVSVDLSQPNLDQIAFDAEIDVVINAAINFRSKTLSEFLAIDQNALKLAKRFGASRFVYLSTLSLCSGFGRYPVTEDCPTSTNSTYLEAKAEGELLALESKSDFTSSSVLRIGAPIGLGMNSDRLLSEFISAAQKNRPLQVYPDGSRVQQYLDTRDLATGAMLLAFQEHASEIYNIGGRDSVSNLDLAKIVIELCESQSQAMIIGAWDQQSGKKFSCDYKRIAELGYRPQFSISDSIRWIIDAGGRDDKGTR